LAAHRRGEGRAFYERQSGSRAADIFGIEPLQFNVRKSPLRDEFDA
jgi:hypothetical protein